MFFFSIFFFFSFFLFCKYSFFDHYKLISLGSISMFFFLLSLFLSIFFSQTVFKSYQTRVFRIQIHVLFLFFSHSYFLFSFFSCIFVCECTCVKEYLSINQINFALALCLNEWFSLIQMSFSLFFFLCQIRISQMCWKLITFIRWMNKWINECILL